MILHLVHDDKVVPRMISQFEAVNPGTNFYICVCNFTEKCQLTFLNNNPCVILSRSKEVSKIPWKSIDKVCFHCLSFKKIRYYWYLCLRYGLKNTKNIWFMWGGDIFDVLYRRGFKLYSDDNFVIQKANDSNSFSLKGTIERYLQELRNRVSDFFKCYFFDKVFDYVVCNLKEEFDLYSQYVRFSRCKMLLQYYYYPIEDTLGDLIDTKVRGNSIIVGNSASITNNHEYVFQFLKDISLDNRTIYIPLNYGRNADYLAVVKKKCAEFSNVVMLDSFLPPEEYHCLLADCSTFIYGHFRLEAWGNILVALYLGGKVYVSRNSLMPTYLNSLGFIFFITEELKSTFDLVLTDVEKEHNRRIALGSFSRDRNKKNIEFICNL